jgi:hypothetical protein
MASNRKKDNDAEWNARQSGMRLAFQRVFAFFHSFTLPLIVEDSRVSKAISIIKTKTQELMATAGDHLSHDWRPVLCHVRSRQAPACSG